MKLCGAGKGNLMNLELGLTCWACRPFWDKIQVCSSLLCHSDSSFGPEQFEQCLNRATDPGDFVQSQAYGWFYTYIGENPKSEFYQGGCRLKVLLHFSTGFQVPPPWSKSSKDHNLFFTWWWWSSVSHSPSLFWLSKAANCSLFKECI